MLLNEDPRLVDKVINTTFRLPDSSFVINRRDDSAEFDEVIPSQQEDPKFITLRKANYVTIKLPVQPMADVKVGDDVYVGFSMQYTYTSVAASMGEKATNVSTPTGAPVALTTRVYVNIGKLAQSA
jgi:dynactin-4